MSRRKRVADRQEYAENLRNIDKIRVLEHDLESARTSKSKMLMNMAELKENNTFLEGQAARYRKKINILAALLGLNVGLVIILAIANAAK